ncbi:Biopolymer transport protein ExbB [Tsuneonella dongtanensis]|uniref:Biopolymer transport protein ExbB n=1 Tax=Tsuneonella dongtanensis TaxID=692370 RepID=A0A1B2ADF4_9SPHN|nr:protein TolQ [Tsuneonella dongtanensis]ANY20192.1 Biopolymer transport protein ExbB [Tsuneonella dongtanensis]
MTDLLLLAAATPELPGRLNPVQLFLDADIVVQAVMIGLLLASVWTWMIIVGFSMRMASVRKRCAEYEEAFWEAESFEALMTQRGKKDIASARVASAAMREWKHSVKGGRVADRDGLRQRLAAAMESQVATEADDLSGRLNFLATVGSVAPFVGLFGTVWGIMNSFFQIGQQQNSSLAVVAPGISEALFATAIGLFAAIPAVIAYNRFGHAVNAIEARLQRFADRFHASLSRELEGM